MFIKKYMITDKDLSILEFNPLVKKPMTSAYPKLREIFGSGEDKMIKYVILMYDVNSPLRHHYPELGKRKEFAASLAGFDLIKDDVISLFEFRVGDEPNEPLLDMIISYLKYQNNWVWSMIVSNEQAFYEYNRRVMMPVEGNRDKDILQAINIKTQIMVSQDEIYQRLQKYYRELSGGDDKLQEVITTRKRLRPEQIADVQTTR